MKPNLKPCFDCKKESVIWKCYGKEKVCKGCAMKRDTKESAKLRCQKPIPKVSKKRSAQLREYSKEKIPEGQICEFPGCTSKATDKHHPQGRENKRLLDPVKYLCRSHHNLITEHTDIGIETGLSRWKHRKAG